MSIKLFIGVTDRDWFDVLSATPGLEEVNFWSPGGRAFKALAPGELFLLRARHAPTMLARLGYADAAFLPAAECVDSGAGLMGAQHRAGQGLSAGRA